jgi:hypothetical protein
MLDRLKSYFLARREDPIPAALTIGACVISVLAATEGGVRDGWNLLTNIEGNLVLIGPGLIVTNIAVKWLQTVRARRTIEPLLAGTGRMLCEGFHTAQQALRLLGSETLPEMPDHRLDFATLAVQLKSAHSQMVTRIDDLLEKREMPARFRNALPLSFPNFGLINAFLQQIDRHHAMPESALCASISTEFANTCGVDFSNMQDLDGGSKNRHVGLARIRQLSQSENPYTTGIFSEAYLKVACECVFRTMVIAECISREALPDLLSDIPDDDDPHWLN